MGKRLGLSVLLLAVVATTLPINGAAALSQPVRPPLPPPDLQQTNRWLHAAHTPRPRIVDDAGRTVILRGVNVNGLGEYYQEWADLPATLPLTEADFAEIAGHGFNVVRLLVTWSRLEPQPGVIDRAYIERIAQAVAWAKKYDIYTLIDMHQDAWSAFVDTPDGVTCPPGTTRAVGWDGAPKWATSLVGTVATCTARIREVSMAAQLSFERFYTNAGGLQDHLLNVWRAVAQRFAGESAVAGYDLLNEPNPGMTPGVNDYGALGLFYRRAIKAIRSVDKRHMIFFEPAVVTGPLTTPGPVPGFSNDANLVYAPHLYNESISPLPGRIKDGFVNASRAAKRYGNAPIFVGEWGWFGNPTDDQPFINEYARQEDIHMASGTWWQWKQACGDPHAIGARGKRPSCAGKSIYSDGLVTRSVNLPELTRGYVRAAPGLLTSMSGTFNRLKATGIASRAGETVEVWAGGTCRSPSLTVWQRGQRVGTGYGSDAPVGQRMRAMIPARGAYEVTVRCKRNEL
ncbi:MAG: cellulase family glycosylhydrolase [Acidimicrobiales bacterium]|nr:cellulase family glycosylhydrolase [Acidimicrobiales bacterium]